MATQRYFGLLILFVVNLVNYLDRLSIAAVLVKIKHDFDLSPPEGGLLATCFLVGFMLTAPIFGYLGDKYSRKFIIIGGILFWSVVAFSGSLIPGNYKFLFFLNRVLVGVGEASYSTIAPTIIADLFEPSQRKMMLSIFYFAIPIGSGLGYVMGNLALNLGDWRYIFKITPAIALMAACALLFLKEPRRGQTEGAQCDSSFDDATVMEDLKYLISIPSYLWATVGFTCCLFAVGALSWWAIEFMKIAAGGQDKDFEKTATLIFGVIICFAGLVGVITGTSSAQYLRRYDGKADPLVCAAGILISVPFVLFGLISAREYTALSWLLLFIGITALSTNWAVVSDMMISVTVPNKRAFATAIQILVSHLCGDATSPFIVGFIRGELKSRLHIDDYLAFLYALLSTLVILVIGGLTFIYSAKFYVNDIDNCKKEMKSDEFPVGILPDTSIDTDSVANLESFAR